MEQAEQIELSLKKLDRVWTELDRVWTEYDDRISTEAKILRKEDAIETVARLRKVIEEKRNIDRLLNIGIVGRVKAGKSSLLNALFFDGEDILPKAATPMTASLTTLSYSKQLKAKVSCFTSDDIKDIKSGWESCKKKIDQELEKQSGSSNTDPATLLRKAKREIKKHPEYPLYEHYEKMQEGKAPLKQEFEILIQDLQQDLIAYVGAGGKHTPFTKSVDISLPNEKLQGIRIIDTPGINDPVPSREERAMELLSTCDVIFIVSPAGQFMNKPDLDLIDRIGTKEGISGDNIFVIVSKIDDVLFGSEKSDTISNAIEGITPQLAEQLQSAIKKLKEGNSEIGSEFDELINQSQERLVHSAGLAYSMQRTFNEKDSWDDGGMTLWNNLREHYPQDFPEDDDVIAKASLVDLCNIKQIHVHIDTVRQGKEKILSDWLSEFIATKQKALLAFIEKLKKFRQRIRKKFRQRI